MYLLWIFYNQSKLHTGSDIHILMVVFAYPRFCCLICGSCVAFRLYYMLTIRLILYFLSSFVKLAPLLPVDLFLLMLGQLLLKVPISYEWVCTYIMKSLLT